MDRELCPLAIKKKKIKKVKINVINVSTKRYPSLTFWCIYVLSFINVSVNMYLQLGIKSAI